MWQGAGKGYQDVLMVTLGTGVGGGCVLDGKMFPEFMVQVGKLVICL